MPSMIKYGSSTIVRLYAANTSGVMIALAMPVSSSSDRNTNPLAVPGRWRVITAPATRTRRPGRPRARSLARCDPARRQRRADERHRMRPNRQPRPVVVRLHPLGQRHGGQGAWGLRLGAWGFGRRASSRRLDSSSSTSSGPAGRPARSACQSAVRRSPPNDASAPLSASARTSSCRKPGARHEIIDGREPVFPVPRPVLVPCPSALCPLPFQYVVPRQLAALHVPKPEPNRAGLPQCGSSSRTPARRPARSARRAAARPSPTWPGDRTPSAGC